MIASTNHRRTCLRPLLASTLRERSDMRTAAMAGPDRA